MPGRPDPSWRIRSAPLALALAVWLAASGVWLALHFRADPGAAHAIVASLNAPGWDRLRALHHWSAMLMIVALAFALGRRWLRGLDEPGDRLVWWAGLVVIGLLLVGFQTGRILAWDQQGWGAYQRAAALLGIKAVTPDQARLTVVHVVHLAMLPAIALVAAPVLRRRAQREGSTAVSGSDAATRRRSRAVATLIASVLAIGLALFFPIGHGAAPTPEVVATQVDWPFLWLVPIAALAGRAGVIIALAGGVALAALAPVVAARLRHRDRVYALLGFVGAWAGLTMLGLR